MIVLDTSAVISLASADVLHVVLDEYEAHTTETVLHELEATAEYDDVHGRAARDALENDAEYTVHTVPEPELSSSRIDAGEASCVHLCHELEANFLFTDDLRALPELQTVVDARVAISPIVLKALVTRDRLTESDARNRLETLAGNRDWLESPIYRRAQNLFDS